MTEIDSIVSDLVSLHSKTDVEKENIVECHMVLSMIHYCGSDGGMGCDMKELHMGLLVQRT